MFVTQHMPNIIALSFSVRSNLAVYYWTADHGVTIIQILALTVSFCFFFRPSCFIVTKQAWYCRTASIIHSVLHSLNTGTTICLCSPAAAEALTWFDRDMKAFFCFFSYGFWNSAERRGPTVQLDFSTDKKRHGWGRYTIRISCSSWDSGTLWRCEKLRAVSSYRCWGLGICYYRVTDCFLEIFP